MMILYIIYVIVIILGIFLLGSFVLFVVVISIDRFNDYISTKYKIYSKIMFSNNGVKFSSKMRRMTFFAWNKISNIVITKLDHELNTIQIKLYFYNLKHLDFQLNHYTKQPNIMLEKLSTLDEFNKRLS